MTSKKVDIGLKPRVKEGADEWVGEPTPARQEEQETVVTKRLTIDVPEELHRQLKLMAVTSGVHMADLVRGWIREKCV